MVLFFSAGFLHRAADLTLVPSAAISKDFETAHVISGWLISVSLYITCHDALIVSHVNGALYILIQLTGYAFGTKVLILPASIPGSAAMR